MAKSKDRKQRDAAECRRHSKTVRYEVANLFGAAIGHTVLKRKTPITPDDAFCVESMQNACVESFAIHCRNLVEFLFAHQQKNPPRTTDVVATDFVAAWENSCPALSDDLAEAKMHADKQVAHITEEREDLNQPGSGKTSEWNFLLIGNEIADLMNQFLALVPDDRFEPQMRDNVLALIDRWNSLTVSLTRMIGMT